MISRHRAVELARLYSDPDVAATPLDYFAHTGRLASDEQRGLILRELRARFIGSTVRECREIHTLIDYAMGAPLGVVA